VSFCSLVRANNFLRALVRPSNKIEVVTSVFIIPPYPYPSRSFPGIILGYPFYSSYRFLTITKIDILANSVNFSFRKKLVCYDFLAFA